MIPPGNAVRNNKAMLVELSEAIGSLCEMSVILHAYLRSEIHKHISNIFVWIKI